MQAKSICDGPFARCEGSIPYRPFHSVVHPRVHCLDCCLLQNRAASPARMRMPETGSRICCCRASHCACVSTRPLPAGCADPPDAPLVCACTPIVNPSVVATMNAVRISVPPCYYGAVVRLTVNRCADEERRELLRCIDRTFDFVLHERESNSLA
jgi:hypothetical protein